jgi:outer membrane protein OmpA-like peptidoglycan-associated protein
MGKKIVVGLLGLALALFAEFNRSSVLIDVPTAYVLRHKVIQGTAVGSFALSTYDSIPSPYDFDLCLGAGIGDFLEISLSAYGIENYSLGFTALLLRENKYSPSVAVGVHEITWVPYIGSFGGGNELSEDPGSGNWNPEDKIIDKPGFIYWEQQEWFSAFAVASKQFCNYFRIHAGVGRGRYTGYGRISKYFNTDIFNEKAVSGLTLGLFGAVEFNYQDWLSVAAEYDGRDVNFGTKVGFNHWELYLAVTRLENLVDITTSYSPRLVAGLNLYTSPYHKAPKGTEIAGKAVYPDGKPASGAKIEVFSDNYTQETTANERGLYKMRVVPAGMVTLVASQEGYRSKPQLLKVTSGSSTSTKEDLVLKDIRDKGTIHGTVKDAEEGSGVLANVYVVETGDVVRTGPRGGSYEIVGLEAGKYTLHAQARGYFDHEITAEAGAGSTTELDINMSKNWIIFHFKPGEKLIEPRYVPVLEDVVRFLKDRPKMVVEIQGHTDSVGDAKVNRALSRKRAEAVRDYLVKRGISERRLVVKGYGELAPIGDNRTILGRDMNRRVELKVLSE